MRAAYHLRLRLRGLAARHWPAQSATSCPEATRASQALRRRRRRRRSVHAMHCAIDSAMHTCNASCNAPSYKWAPPAGAALTDAAPSRASEAPGFWPAVYVGTLALSLAAEPLLKVLPPAIPPQPSPRSCHHHGRCSPLSSRPLRCSARTPGSASGAPSPRRSVALCAAALRVW